MTTDQNKCHSYYLLFCKNVFPVKEMTQRGRRYLFQKNKLLISNHKTAELCQKNPYRTPDLTSLQNSIHTKSLSHSHIHISPKENCSLEHLEMTTCIC